MAKSDRERLYDVLEEFDTAMLVTRAADGELRARPMAIADKEENGDVWFVTQIDSPKVDEIQADPRVNVSLQADNRWLSITGTAAVVRDRAKIEELWKPDWKVWFPDGKDDPELSLIQVRATEGEYWDFAGGNQLTFLFEAAKAYLQGEEMEDSEERSQKVDL